MGEQKKTSNNLFYIRGVDCPDCGKALEREIYELPEVTKAKLIFSLGKLEVDYGQVDVDMAKMNEKIKGIVEGHGGKLRENSIKGEKHPAARKNFYQLLREMGQGGAVSAIVSGSLMILAVIFLLLNMPPILVKSSFAAVILIGGWATFGQGLRSLLKWQFDMNVLMTIAVIGAIAIGEWLEGSIIAFLFSLSNTLENYSMEKTRNSVKELMNLAPPVATVKRCGEKTVPVDEVQVGDVVVVRPGEKIPMDGKVIYGSSWVNEAPITGESMLQEKGINSQVYAGSINEGGYLEMSVTKLAKENTIAKIIQLVETALAEKPPVQRLVDKFASYYTPIILLLAVAMVSIPTVILGQELTPWIYRSLALLLIACPCALVISTPVALVTAMGSGAKDGILIKGGNYLEEMARIKVIALDKTGTITKGKPVVNQIIAKDLHEDQWLPVVYALEKMSEHPLAKSFVHFAQSKKNILVPRVSNFNVVPGKGVTGQIADEGFTGKWVIGTSRLLAEERVLLTPADNQQIEDLQQAGEIVVAVGCNHQLVGLITFTDQVRSEAKTAVAQLKNLGLDTVMLTGDNEQVAKRIAQQVGIEEVYGRLLPEEKLAKVQEMMESKKKVAMVGDGINDGPALAKASVGIAMGVAGTDTALETADVALMGDDLTKLPALINLSKRTLQIIKENIILAVSLKLLAVALIFPGWLTLWMAVLADMGTSLLVTVNGLRLLKR